ncbi:unnamed protein product [Rotaria magnacalcarata]|uniref:AB hydrolase-1 domain-containing protein n=2 Tax=Rotaria magnacalcarata TaxID=392030 RepID=A0A816FZJ0_9BILA|nr:unnamed protein product [Rotaria magnacalcarata]CAF1667743.1 unnamed protein product [Rotaria magnacalcarata]
MPMKSDYFTLAPDIKIYYELHFSSPPSNSSTKIIMIMGAYATLRNFDESVEYLLEHYPSSIEILTYDHRGIGYSKGPTLERQTTSLLARDAYQLVNHVWGNQSPVHVIGVSLGGMVAQELAVILIPEQRLLSLYLGVTTRGSYIRPFSLLPKCFFSRIILPYFSMKSDNEKMLRSIAPYIFNEIEQEEMEELIKKYLTDCDKWFIFQDIDGCAQHNVAFNSHYLTDQHIQQIKTAQIPVTVQISMQDKLLPARKQQELADSLNAKILVLERAGHTFNRENRLKMHESILRHIQSATN